MSEHVSLVKDAALSTPPVAVLTLQKIGVILSPILTILTVIYTICLLWKWYVDFLEPLMERRREKKKKKEENDD